MSFHPCRDEREDISIITPNASKLNQDPYGFKGLGEKRESKKDGEGLNIRL